MMDLVAKLAPVVDRVRSLHGYFGTRPYRVWLVRSRWTGPRRGEGEEVILEEEELVPTPLVTGIESLQSILEGAGREEEGIIEVSQISLTLPEEKVGFGGQERDIPSNECRYWEVRYADGRRRRFTPISPPERDIRTMGWRVRLRKQVPDRLPSGGAYR